MMVTIDRGDYYQCGSNIRKGAFEEIKRRGLEAFREEIVGVADRRLAASVPRQVHLMHPVLFLQGLLKIVPDTTVHSPAM